MRAKEFITEYAIVGKPTFKINPTCPECKGSGNTDAGDSTQTCPSCKGVGSQQLTQDSPQSGYASDADASMNSPDTLWAAGKF
jgi:DnaJ-class molecular chaperone